MQHKTCKINHIIQEFDYSIRTFVLHIRGHPYSTPSSLFPQSQLPESPATQKLINQWKMIMYTQARSHTHTHTHVHSPLGTVPGDGSVEGFLQCSFCSSGSSAPPGLHAASLYTLNISPPAPGAVQYTH